MNILDLNDDIMSKIIHNLFLKSLMKHRKDNFVYDDFDLERWESRNDFDFVSLKDGKWGCSFPPEFTDDTYDLKLLVYPADWFNNS
eukprot:SAG11_NODE_4730_length_1788_cov_14.219065_2_plen_86_part_00